MEIPSIFIYLAKVTACFTLLYGFYLLFLSRLKKPITNRFVLLVAIVVSLGLPLISVSYTVTKVVDVVVSSNNVASPNISSTEIINGDNLVEVATASNIEKPPANSLFLSEKLWLITYLAMVCLLALRLVWQVARFVLLLKKSARIEFVGTTKVWVCNCWGQTFSFFRLIVFSDKDFRNPSRHLLLQHELVHAHQLHSLDLLLAELFSIVFWFNPLVYWYKRSLAEVHEFIADTSVVHHGVDSLEYKKLILDCVSTTAAPRVANSFSAKLLKNRFAMLTNINETGGIYRYLLLMPIAAVLFGLFSFTLEQKVEYVQPDEPDYVEPMAVEYDSLAVLEASIEDKFENDEKVVNERKVDDLAEPKLSEQSDSGAEDVDSELSASDSTLLYKRLDSALDEDLEKMISAFQKPETNLFFSNLILGDNTPFTILATSLGSEMPQFVLTSKENGSVVNPTAKQITGELVKLTYLVEKAGEYNVKLSNPQNLTEVLYYLALPKDTDGKIDFGFRVMNKTIYLKEKDANTTATIDALRLVSDDEEDVTILRYSTGEDSEEVKENEEKDEATRVQMFKTSFGRSKPGDPDYIFVTMDYNGIAFPEREFKPNLSNTNLTTMNFEDANSWPLSYIHKSINYPRSYKPKRRNPDVVEVEFNLTKEGEITDVMVTKGINPEVDAELVRVISQMPGWQPEKPYGEPISPRVTMAFCLVKQ